MKERTLVVWLRMATAIAVIGLTSCENGNLFGKLNKTGHSGDTATLTSEADNALRKKDYTQALALAEQVLSKDPNNSQALYTAAAAGIGTSGLNVGTIVSNILRQQASASSVRNLGDLIAKSRENISSVGSTTPNDILANINIAAVDSVIDLAICRLQQIVSGASDGSIPSNNIDTIVNLAVLRVLRAGIRPVRDNLISITNTNGNFGIVQLVDLSAACSTNKATIEGMAVDVVSAYALLNRAVTVLNLSGNQIILQIRNDIQDVGAQLLTNDSGHPNHLPSSCLTLLDTELGINNSNFTSYSHAFDPPTGC